MYKLIIAGLGVLAVALLATGCGGGGSDEATAQVTKAEFYNQARAICAKTQKKLLAEIAASKNPDAVYSTLAQLREKEAEELEALSGSEAVEEEVQPFVATILKASRLVAREGQEGGDDPSFRAYKQESVDLGLKEC